MVTLRVPMTGSGLVPSLNGFGKCFIFADPLAYFSLRDLDNPCLRRFPPTDTSVTGSVVRSSFPISGIPTATDSPKVIPAVVRSVAVDMVNVFLGPLARLNQPDHAVGLDRLSEDRAGSVSCTVDGIERWRSSKSLIPTSGQPVSVSRVSFKPLPVSDSPCKASSGRVIINELFHSLKIKFHSGFSFLFCSFIKNEGSGRIA